MPDVLITENIIGEEIDVLRKNFDVIFEPELWKRPDLLPVRITDFKAIIVRNQTQVTREFIAAGKRLQIIGRAGVGLDNVDLQAATDYGVVVAFAPEQNTNSVAEMAIGLLFALARKIPAADRDTKRGGWDRHGFTGSELLGKTLGIVGLGRIGASTAVKARALGMEILAFDPFVDAGSLKVMELRAELATFDEVLQRADFVTCHLPLTSETKNLFSYERFCLMKPGAFFVNTARGGVVEEAGLIRALLEMKIAGAALDVRDQEPPSLGPLVDMENLILTPHVAGFTREAQRRVVSTVCRDVVAVLNGLAAKNYANFSTPRRVEG